MITIRKSKDRGHANHGWLDTYHTFSFNTYRDERFMGFRSLRVINEDFVEPKKGFGTHPHHDMEIITYVVEGALNHKDSMHTDGIIRPGDVQRMSAGSGVLHSEFNASETDRVHLLQIWILPEKKGVKPSYEQKTYARDDKLNRLRLIASNDARDGSMHINQDAAVYASVLEAGKSLNVELGEDRHAWIQLIRGKLDINDETLEPGDGAAISTATTIKISAGEESEFIFFDLA